MSYPRWICLTTALTLIFTTGGLWLEARLKGEPAAVAKANAQDQNVQTEVITATLQVLITGAVQKPGIYRLPAGSSIQTLLGPLAEGGLLGGADDGTRVVLLTGSMGASARLRV